MIQQFDEEEGPTMDCTCMREQQAGKQVLLNLNPSPCISAFRTLSTVLS